MIDEQLGYWREQLRDAPELLELPTDRPRPAMRRARAAFTMSSSRADPVTRMRELAREESATLLVAFLAAYVALLVPTGTTGRDRRRGPGGRPAALRAQRMVGYFLNWLPIKVDVGDRPSLRT